MSFSEPAGVGAWFMRVSGSATGIRSIPNRFHKDTSSFLTVKTHSAGIGCASGAPWSDRISTTHSSRTPNGPWASARERRIPAMKAYDTGSIRNVAVIGHSGAGKTQLVAALLFTAGATPRLGRVDDGTTLTDYDEEEIARKHTLSASLAWAEWNKSKINIIDTPGMGNFLADARAGLRVADAALLVVDAVSGVEVQTEKVWAEAESMGLPRLVVVSRLDRERASLDRTLTSLREFCSRTVVPIQMPIGEERGFTGVVDLVSMKAWTFAADGSGKASEGSVPAALADEARAARDALIEMVAEADDA